MAHGNKNLIILGFLGGFKTIYIFAHQCNGIASSQMLCCVTLQNYPFVGLDMVFESLSENRFKAFKPPLTVDW